MLCTKRLGGGHGVGFASSFAAHRTSSGRREQCLRRGCAKVSESESSVTRRCVVGEESSGSRLGGHPHFRGPPYQSIPINLYTIKRKMTRAQKTDCLRRHTRIVALVSAELHSLNSFIDMIHQPTSASYGQRVLAPN